jgi:hypothetical protein
MSNLNELRQNILQMQKTNDFGVTTKVIMHDVTAIVTTK